MGIEATGKVYAVFETKQVSERFSKREFVVEIADNPKYPQLVLFQATGDRCDQLNDIQDGDEVRIEFSLRGREWRSPSGELRYFNSLDVWKIERVGYSRSTSRRQDGGQHGRQQSMTTSAAATDRSDAPPKIDDDIPF